MEKYNNQLMSTAEAKLKKLEEERYAKEYQAKVDCAKDHMRDSLAYAR